MQDSDAVESLREVLTKDTKKRTPRSSVSSSSTVPAPTYTAAIPFRPRTSSFHFPTVDVPGSSPKSATPKPAPPKSRSASASEPHRSIWSKRLFPSPSPAAEDATANIPARSLRLRTSTLPTEPTMHRAQDQAEFLGSGGPRRIDMPWTFPPVEPGPKSGSTVSLPSTPPKEEGHVEEEGDYLGEEGGWQYETGNGGDYVLG